MDFLDWAKNRQLPSALQSRTGWSQIFEHYRTSSPHIHQIEPTNHCPYSCLMCPRKRLMTRARGYMEMGTFIRIIDEITTFPQKIRDKEIELFHFGESLLHPRLPEMVAYMSERSLKATLSINPCELSHSLIDRLVNSKPFHLILSIDSMDQTLFRKLRGHRAHLATAVAHTELLLKSFQAAGSQSIVTVRMIVMNENAHESEQFTNFWKSRGANVQLREFFPWNDKDIANLGTVQKYPPFMPCPFPWQYLVIQWNGDVVACCRDYNAQLVLGSIMESSLQEIWESEKAQHLRDSMASGAGIKDLCKECLQMYYTES